MPGLASWTLAGLLTLVDGPAPTIGPSSPTLAGLPAPGDEPAPTIDWQAPPECPDAAEVARMTTTLLRARSAASVPLEVHATVVRAAGRLELTLVLRSPLGGLERALTGDTCLPLARAVALVVAVHLDPLRVARNIAEPAPVEPTDPTPEIAAPSVDEAGPAMPPPVDDEVPPGLIASRPRTPARPPGERGGHLRVEGGLGYGVVPAAEADVALFGGAWGPRWRVEGGFLAAPGREVLAPGGARGGRFGRLTAVLRGCASWRVTADREALQLHGCLGGEVGALAAVGTRGVAAPTASWTPWGALRVGPAARVRLIGPLGLWVGVDAVIALRRPTFTVAAETLFTGAPVAVHASFGLDLQIVARKRRVPVTR